MIPLRDNIPSRKFPIVNYLLISLNAIVFIYELNLSPHRLDEFLASWAVVPSEIFGDFLGEYKTLFTAMFLHGGWLHFLGNMLFLYIFGDNVEDKFGHIRYLIFYILCGFVAFILQIFFMIGSRVPLIGASGAIAGVLGAYLLLFPRARILTLVPLGIFLRVVELPAFFFLGIWFLMQIFYGLASIGATSGVAWWAHIGGFLCGIITVGWFKKYKR